MTVEMLGERLKKVRTYLGLSQKELAEKLIEHSDKETISQNSVSRIETGKGGDISFLLAVLSFFSKYIYIDLIFSDNFEIVTNESNALKKHHLNSIICAKLQLAKKDFDGKIDDVIKYLE